MTDIVCNEKILQTLNNIDNNILDYQSLYAEYHETHHTFDFSSFIESNDIDAFAAPMNIMLNVGEIF
ncbi:MAG: hypothetical protein U9N81_12805 [Bacillota bacterium]|nr:hypothetical protein [Bacillota bacterium]